jgi:hypothetical protein
MATTFPIGKSMEFRQADSQGPWSEPDLIEHERGQNGRRQILSGK